jgi:hypothetical protein
MFGVLVIVLGRYPIARLEFCLGQGYVPIIVSSRVVRTLWLWAQRIRWSLLRGQQMVSFDADSCLSSGHAAWLTPG